MPQKFSNKARSQLLAAISSADTSFSVVATDADLFPAANVGTGTLPSAPGDWFKAVIEDSDGYEIVYVRTRSAGSNVFSNVLRGQEGTTARSFPAGAVVGLRVTAQDAETAAKVPDLQAQITGLASSKLDVAATSFGGNAATATKLQTARTITIGNTGKSVDGSANVAWSLDEIGAAASVHAHTISNVTGLQTALDGKISSTEKGAANGVAPLGADSKIPATYLPSYVDDVLEYANQAAFPSTGATGTIYVDLATNRVYRWSGSAYVEISPSPGSTDAVPEGATNLYFTDARARAAVVQDTISDAVTDRAPSQNAVFDALAGKANTNHTHAIANVTGLQAALDGKANTTHTHGDADLTAISWNKVTGKPTSLSGYGITDAVNASDVVTTAAPNKILKLDTNSKLPASITGNADGTAATATKLQTARTITIGNTGKSFDGSADVSWSLDEIGLPTSISVVGPTSAYVTTTVTLTITDFDDFDTYNVTASHGTISRSGATITYTAPGTVPGGGADTITIQRGTGQRVLTIQILPAAVLPPTVTVTGAPSDVPETPLIGTSAFQTVGVSDTHASTTWRVRKVVDNSVVWESVNNTANKTQITVPSGILQENTQYRFEAIHNGTTLGASAVGFIQATTKQQFAIIIGLVQTATGGGAGTYVRIDENFAPKSTDAAFFNNHPTYSGIVTQTIDGQQMVKIPKFWFKAGTVPSGTYAGKTYWMIADKPAPGFSVHPAFIGAGGVELDQIWVGKYQASASGGKLQSVPGVLPRVSMDFPTARAEAYARNVSGVSGFRLCSYYDLAAIQMLASIEMGGLDMQALIGQGRVSQSSAANVDASDVAQATWRGIVGLWGNVWQMVDGIKRNGGNWWRWQYNAPGNTTTSDFATGYVNTGQAALTSNGYPVTFYTTLLSEGIIVPATVDGTAANGSTGDYFYSNANTDDRIAYHGGDWGHGANAGLFDLAVTNAPSDASPHIGCRLAKV